MSKNAIAEMDLCAMTDPQLTELKYETCRRSDHLAYFRRWGALAEEEDRLKAIEAEQLRRDGEALLSEGKMALTIPPELQAALERAQRALANPTMTVGNNIVATLEVDRALAIVRSLSKLLGGTEQC